jgi:inosine-uridine nucleoside N-ribohydrolase
VPLDVTMREVMTEEQLAQLAASAAAPARFAASILAFYFDYYSNIFGRRACA